MRYPPAVTAVLENPGYKVGLLFFWLYYFLAFSRGMEFFGEVLIHRDIYLVFLSSLLALATCLFTGGLARALGNKIGMLYALQIVLTMIACIFSVWRSDSIGLFMSTWLKSFFAFVLTAGLLLTIEHVKKAMHLIAIAAIMIVLLSFFFGTYGGGEGRFALTFGTLANPNGLANNLLFFLPFLAFVLENPRAGKLVRVGTLVGIMLSLLTIVKTGSRAGLITSAAIAVMVFFKFSPGKKMVAVLALPVLVILGLVTAKEDALVRYKTIFFKEAKTEAEESAALSGSMRLRHFQDSMEIMLQHPLTGVGPGQFTTVAVGMAVNQGDRVAWEVSHNTFGQVGSETGLIAFVCWCALLIQTGLLLSKVRRLTKPFPALSEARDMAYFMNVALISFVLYSCFSNEAYQYHFPTLAALAIVFHKAVTAEVARLSTPVVPSMAAPLRSLMPRQPWATPARLPMAR